MNQRRIVMLSGGEGSLRAALIERARFPKDELLMVFTDVLYEDADTYRFLLEGACLVEGVSSDWVPQADKFPDYRVPLDHPIETYAGNAAWRGFLSNLREKAGRYLPSLVWLVEGRDPWEVFRDERFLGNSSVDPCSKVLKRSAIDKWRAANCRREGELFGPPDIFSVGIGDHERHRFDDGKGGGIGPRTSADGWVYHAPLLTSPDDFPSLFAAPIEKLGVKRQRLYALGYQHANCGGFCCKAGHAHWANRFTKHRERFEYDREMERKVRKFLGADVSMLTDRRGGDGKKPLPLSKFEERLVREPGKVYEMRPGESGCGCIGVFA